MGRGHVRAALVAAGCALTVVTAASAGGVRWSVVAQGRTEPKGQAPVGYVARSRAAAHSWAGRLTAADRRTVLSHDFRRSALVAVVADGYPCASDLRLTGFSANRRQVVVSLKKPRIGIATCVVRSISYVVVATAKASLPASRIGVVVHARS